MALYQLEDIRSGTCPAAGNDCRIVAVTRGAAGAAVLADGPAALRLKAEVRQRGLVDTTGAGDLVCRRVSLWLHAKGLPLPKSAGSWEPAAATRNYLRSTVPGAERSLREVAAAHLV